MNVGDLSVLKTVNGSGAETDREFSFTLTLINEAGVTVDNTYETSEGTLTVTGGKATFSLKGGESLSIYGIPEGTDYTVTELTRPSTATSSPPPAARRAPSAPA